jgi:hypothetical protein
MADGMVCVEGLCMGSIPAVGGTAQMSTVADGMKGYVRLTANPMGGSEQIILRIRIYDINNPTDADTATWVVNSINYAGVDELSATQNLINVFPNPTQNSFAVNTTISVDKVEVLGLDGKLLLSQVYTENELINIQDLPTSVYLVKVYKEGELLAVEKLIKND